MSTPPVRAIVAAALLTTAAVRSAVAAGPATQPTGPSLSVTGRVRLIVPPVGPDGVARITVGPDGGMSTSGNQVFVFANPAGRTERAAFLGVTTSAVPDGVLRDQLKLPRGVGLVIESVAADSPAAAAGLKVHDVVVKVDDQWAVNEPQMGVLVRLHHGGDEVSLSVIRGGQPEQVRAKLVERDVFVADASAWPAVPPDGRSVTVYPAADATGSTAALRAAIAAVNAIDLNGRPATTRPVDARAALLLPLPTGINTAADIAVNDGGHTLRLTTADTHRHLTVIGPDGKTTFDGPLDTPEQRKALPPDVAAMLDKYQNLIDHPATPEPVPVNR